MSALMFHLLYRNLYKLSALFCSEYVGVFTCSFIFQAGKISGNQDAFPLLAPLSLILISMLRAVKLHSVT